MNKRLILSSATLLLIFGVAFAHTTPTQDEQDIIDANSAPASAVDSGGCSQGASVSTTPGKNYVVIGGTSSGTSGANVNGYQGLSNGGALIDFRVTPSGTITNIRSGVTAHLLYHQNLSLPGSFNSFWFAAEYVTDSTNANADLYNIAGSAGKYTVAGSVLAVAVGANVGNFTQSSGPCGGGITFGRLFDPDLCPCAPQAPGAPVLGGSISYMDATLSWTQPSGTPLGYNLTRLSPQGEVTITPLPPLPLTFQETLNRNGTWRYNITAWNADGTSTVSNTVWLNATYQPLFGDAGTLWGENGRQGLADSSGFTYTSIGVFFGFLLVIFLTSGGFFIGYERGFGTIGAVSGFVGGVALSAVFGFFNAAIVAFLGISTIALFLVFKLKGGE